MRIILFVVAEWAEEFSGVVEGVFAAVDCLLVGLCSLESFLK